MRKKLLFLGFALTAAVAASTVAPARALPITNPCPSGQHLFRCPTYSFCCPDNAFCICIPR